MSSMSNLRTAQLAIEAEIAHARQGLAYYAERVNSLEQALAGIVNAETSVGQRAPVESAKSRTKNAKRKEKAQVGVGAKPLPPRSRNCRQPAAITG